MTVVVAENPGFAALAEEARSSSGARRRPDLGLIAAALWLAVIACAAIGADLLPLRGFEETNFDRIRQAPFQSWSEPLGTDALGRSELSRVIFGARASLLVGFGGAAVGAIVGMALGLVAGYRRGRLTDDVVTFTCGLVLSFPPLFLLLAAVSVWGANLVNLTAGLAVVSIPAFARIARANTIAHSSREYVTAARMFGARTPRILTRDLIPNVAPSVASYALVVAAILIVAEGSLSYIGLGVPSPTPSWGGMIADGRRDIETSPHLVLIPGAATFLAVLALNRLGDELQRRVHGRDSNVGAKR